MPKIKINISTFERLEKHGKMFVDTEDSVINKALDALENLSHLVPIDEPSSPQDEYRFMDPFNPPIVTHTFIKEAWLDGETVHKPSWNGLLAQVLILASARVSNVDELRQISAVTLKQGYRKRPKHFFMPEINMLFRAMNAIMVCKKIVNICQKLDLSLKLIVEWRNKPVAAFPGEKGQLILGKTTDFGE